MRLGISLWLALRFFLRTLLAYFALFWLVSICIFSVFLAINSYEYQVDKRFSSKQPHLTLSLDFTDVEWRAYMNSMAGKTLKNKLQEQANILAVSEFSKVRKWLHLNAAANQINSIDNVTQFDKFSVGDVTIIGLEQIHPSVIPLGSLSYYNAGLYKFKITNLEFVAEWLTNSQLVIPNAVLDASFYPPISQEVIIKSSELQTTGKIKAFLNDYNDESILYMGLDTLQNWTDTADVKEQGIYVTLLDSSKIITSQNALKQVLSETGLPWLVTSWLDEKSKQKTILLITKLMSYILIVVLVLMLLLILLLNQTRVFINKVESLKIFYMTGYLLTRPLSLLILGFSFMGILFAYVFAYIWITPMILQLFGLTVDISTSTAWMVIISVALIVNFTSIFSMQSRLIYS